MFCLTVSYFLYPFGCSWPSLQTKVFLLVSSTEINQRKHNLPKFVFVMKYFSFSFNYECGFNWVFERYFSSNKCQLQEKNRNVPNKEIIGGKIITMI